MTSVVLIGMVSACNYINHSKRGVELAMKEYDHLIKEMNADSIALLYTTDGDMGNMAHGRDSIRNFLATFKNFYVLSQESTSSSIEICGDSSVQKGTYKQVVIVPPKDTVTVNGEYTANWVWVAGEGWHIKHMATKPLN